MYSPEWYSCLAEEGADKYASKNGMQQVCVCVCV